MHKYNGFSATTKWLATLFIVLLVASGCSQQPTKSDTTDIKVESLGAKDLKQAVREDAPKTYTVKKGDTLWDISGHFLNRPELWPKIWRKNKYIENPDLIYPGDRIILTYKDGRPIITLAPKIRETPAKKPIPVVPKKAVQAMLSAPRVIKKSAAKDLPYIVSLKNDHVIASQWMRVYVRGHGPNTPETLDIVEPKKQLKIDGTQYSVLDKVGQLKIDSFDQPVATATTTQANREIKPGERLIAPRTIITRKDFELTVPKTQVLAHVLVGFGTSDTVSQYETVLLDKGANQGLSLGNLLWVYKASARVKDPISRDTIDLPAERVGVILIYETQDNLSLGLVLMTEQRIKPGDLVRTLPQ